MKELKLQILMNEFYDFWEKYEHLPRLEVLKLMSELHQVAVKLGNLNYQVNNGGFSQWEFNEYNEDIEDLKIICDKGISLNIEEFKKLKQILVEYSEIPDYNTQYEEKDCFECGGSGKVEDYNNDEIKVTCSECGGSGKQDSEVNKNRERNSLFKRIDDKYSNVTNIVNKMEELINRWDEINILV